MTRVKPCPRMRLALSFVVRVSPDKMQWRRRGCICNTSYICTYILTSESAQDRRGALHGTRIYVHDVSILPSLASSLHLSLASKVNQPKPRVLSMANGRRNDTKPYWARLPAVVPLAPNPPSKKYIYDNSTSKITFNPGPSNLSPVFSCPSVRIGFLGTVHYLPFPLSLLLRLFHPHSLSHEPRSAVFRSLLRRALCSLLFIASFLALRHLFRRFQVSYFSPNFIAFPHAPYGWLPCFLHIYLHPPTHRQPPLTGSRLSCPVHSRCSSSRARSRPGCLHRSIAFRPSRLIGVPTAGRLPVR